MNYGEVISRAWNIIWKHKVLWIFGILASCTSTSNTSNFRVSEQREMPPQMQQFFNQLTTEQTVLLVIGIILVVLLLLAIAIFLGTMGKVGLIRGVQQAERGSTSLAFGELFSGSMPYFWRVFGLNLLVGLAIAAIVILVTVPLAITVVGIACLIPFFCLLVPVGWLISVVIEQSNAAIVVDNLGLLDGLKRGWEVVRNNLGPVIVMGLILFVVGLVAGLIIGLPVVAFIIPAVIGGVAGTRTALGGGLLVTALCLVAYLPVLLVLNGILVSFIQSAWALTYLRLTGHPAAGAVQVFPAA